MIPKSLKSLCVALVAVACLTGCLNVPKTKISGTIGGQKFSGSFPKDADLSDLEVSAQTNGTVKLHIGALKTRMNPDVVQQSAAGQAQIMTAAMNGAGNIAGDVTQKALQAYFGQYGAPVPSVPSVTATNK